MHQVVSVLRHHKSDTRPKTCASCRRVFVPRRRWQTFCSPGCRLDAFRSKANGAPETHGMVRPTRAAKINDVRPSSITETPVKPHFQNAFQQGVRAPHRVIEVEVFGGRAWRQVVSPDGVTCEVSTLRKRALRDGGAS